MGHIVNKDEISVNPDQIREVKEMKETESIKKNQILSGKIAALHMFIIKSSYKIKPLKTMVRGYAKFEWTVDRRGFRQIKCNHCTHPLGARGGGNNVCLLGDFTGGYILSPGTRSRREAKPSSLCEQKTVWSRGRIY